MQNVLFVHLAVKQRQLYIQSTVTDIIRNNTGMTVLEKRGKAVVTIITYIVKESYKTQ